MHGDVSRFNSPKVKLNYPCSIPGEGHSGVCPQLSPIAISSETANAYLRRQDYQGWFLYRFTRLNSTSAFSKASRAACK